MIGFAGEPRVGAGRAGRGDRDPAAVRRRAVERLLAREGLVRGPRPLFGRGAAPGDDPGRRSWEDRFAAVLLEIGETRETGWASIAFGRHLARRPDLLAAGPCRRLAAALALAPSGPPELGPEEASERAAAALGRRLDELFTAFDPDPLPAGPGALDQTHRGRLVGGEPAWVRISRLGALRELDPELDLLAALAPALPRGVDGAAAVADFRADLADREDLAARARDLALLAACAGDRELPALGEVVAALSTPEVLTIRSIPLPARPAAGPPSARDDHHRARAFFRGWLRLALEGPGVVIGGTPYETVDGRWALDAPRLAVTTAAGESPDVVRDYLRAVAAHDPEAAFAALSGSLATLPGTRPGTRSGARPDPAAEAELARRMRQAVPFGDLSVTGFESVADHALLHWRLIREHGFVPRPGLQAFYRGLFWAVAALPGADFGGERDPLREAIEDALWKGGWDSLAGMAEPERMGAMLEGHLEAMATLPRTLERAVEALERMERAPDGEGGPFRARGARRPRRERLLTALAAVLAMVTMALALMEGAKGGPGDVAWSRVLGAVAFVALGAVALRALGGDR